MSILKSNKNLLFLSMDPFYPDQAGGAQYSTLTLLKVLQKKGWNVFVMCRLARSEINISLNINSIYFATDIVSGIPLIRYNNNINSSNLLSLFLKHIESLEVTHVIGEFFNSKIEECFSLLSYSASHNIKSFCIIRVIEGLKEVNNVLHLPRGVKVIANSNYSSLEIKNAYGMDVEIVHPFIDFKSVKAKVMDPEYVTFINPVQVKGVETAIDIALKMPETKFLFVSGGWGKHHYVESNPTIEKIKCVPNITLLEYQNDMAKVYSKTKLLLVPSHFEETFGRVILEAQSNGIPVIGSNRGNIPYTIGGGGFVINDYKNPDEYVLKIRELLEDKKKYKDYSKKALENSQKQEFSLDFQIKKMISILE